MRLIHALWAVTTVTPTLLTAVATATAAQTTAVALQAPAATGSYVVLGNPSNEDIERLLSSIRKLKTVEQAEIQRLPGAVVLRVRGSAQGTILLTAARAAGFRLSQMPVRTYAATGLSGEADLAKFRDMVEKLSGVEQVEMGKQAAKTAVRVRGAIEPSAIRAAIKPAGFDLQMVSTYVASGPSAEAELVRMTEILKRAAGVEAVEMRPVVGGANLLVRGDSKDADLIAAAKTAGYSLLPVSDPASNDRRFAVRGTTQPEDVEKLRTALSAVGGIGEIRMRNTPDGLRVAITNGAVSTPAVVAGALAAGFDLVPVETVTLPSIDGEGERNTPPAPNERTLDELATVGVTAPDFTLVTKDGKGKVKLSDYRGKRPVVLIFGSYT